MSMTEDLWTPIALPISEFFAQSEPIDWDRLVKIYAEKLEARDAAQSVLEDAWNALLPQIQKIILRSPWQQPIPSSPEWQPIETAPKDGTRVLLYIPDLGDDACLQVGYFSVRGFVENGVVKAHIEEWRGMWCDDQDDLRGDWNDINWRRHQLCTAPEQPTH